MKARKFLCLFVMALMVFAVSGCGGGHSGSVVDNTTPISLDVTPTPTSPDVTPTSPDVTPEPEEQDSALEPTVNIESTAAKIVDALQALDDSIPDNVNVTTLPESAVGAERDASDLSAEDTAAITETDNIMSVLPLITVQESAIYVFGVDVSSLSAGESIDVYVTQSGGADASAFRASDDEDDMMVVAVRYIYALLDDNGNVINTVPANKHVSLAAYLAAGITYSHVITTPKASTTPDEPAAPVDSDDNRPTPTDSDDPEGVDNRPTPPTDSDDNSPTPPTDSDDPEGVDNRPTPPDKPSTESEDVNPGGDDSGDDSGSDDSGGDSGSEEVMGETYTSSTSMENALLVNGTTATYSNITVTKTGDATGDSDGTSGYDWTGTNAAILAKGKANLTITGATITSNATGGNAVFSYGGNNSNNSNNSGDGTTVTISDSKITTTGSNSGGIMTTGGGIMNASNLTITTSGGSSAAIRSDSGGGTVTVSGGTYTTSGRGSPAIYSTAEISVYGADLTSNTSQVVVIEGGNSVDLTEVTMNANHNTFNGNDSSYQAVLIYQSMSGDASNGTSSFKMTDGSITNANGDIFFVTNTTCTIDLSNVSITNNDSSGNFLQAAAGGWGSSGSNGGKVTLNASGQDIKGDVVIDSVSTLAMTLKDSSTFTGAIPSGGTVSVTIEEGSTWALTGNSYVTSLNNSGTINKGSYTLYVNNVAQQ